MVTGRARKDRKRQKETAGREKIATKARESYVSIPPAKGQPDKGALRPQDQPSKHAKGLPNNLVIVHRENLIADLKIHGIIKASLCGVMLNVSIEEASRFNGPFKVGRS